VHQESAEWAAYARQPPEGHRLVVACIGDDLIGYGRSEPCSDDDRGGAGEVAGLYVRPVDQGRGAGHARLTWLVDDLLARRLHPVVLGYFAGNGRAASVYAAAGFVPDGARRPVPGLDVDEVRVRLASWGRSSLRIMAGSPRGTRSAWGTDRGSSPAAAAG